LDLESNMINCQICQYSVKSLYGLARHLTSRHNQDHKNYYDQYIKKENEGLCFICKKSTRFNSMTRGYSKYCCQLCVWKDPENIKNRTETFIIKYGQIHPNKNLDIKKKISFVSKKNWKIQYQKRIDIKSPFCARIGLYETQCLDFIQTNIGIEIERGKFIGGYFLDGYINQFNIALEFDEEHHYVNGNLNKKDIDRQNQLERLFNITFIRIDKREWEKNKMEVLNSVKEFIK